MAVSIDSLDTPAVLIDIDKVEANLARAQGYADAHGLKLRPHIKTHKLPALARRQVELGAVGITCQKLGEAEVMAEAGLDDIFLPYNILGLAKLARLVALAAKVRLSVTADSNATVAGYSAAFAPAGFTLPVLVECDTGMGRAGVTTPEEAVALARRIDASPGLDFAGLMTYPLPGAIAAVKAWLEEAAASLAKAGLAARIVSSGGTPDIWRAHENTAATEHRPGTYIYLDRYQVAKNVGAIDDCAMTVLSTVVSRPTETRAILDAGSKALTSDTLGMDGFGLILGYEQAKIAGLSEEHGHVDLTNAAETPAIGERVRVVPNHACVVSNLFDKVYFVSGERVVDAVPVAARGRVG
jgi:D-serine deaminase-like pyridoxal phosphate-dependent protein